MDKAVREATNGWDKDEMERIQLEVGKKIKEVIWEIEDLVENRVYDDEEQGYVEEALNRELGQSS